MRHLKILIVEDEILIAELISTYVQEIGHTVLGIAISYEEALKEYNLRKPDLILLDIRLYGAKSGIDFAQYLNEQKETLPIVYLSSQYDQRTLKIALDTNPYGYLTKPIRKETLWTSIEAAYQLYESKNPKKLQVNLFDGKNHHVVNSEDILYIEADHVYLHIFLVNGQKIYIRKSLKQMSEILIDNNLIQCHRSYIVNRNFIKSRNAESLKLSNDIIIPISRGKKNIFNEDD